MARPVGAPPADARAPRRRRRLAAARRADDGHGRLQRAGHSRGLARDMRHLRPRAGAMGRGRLSRPVVPRALGPRLRDVAPASLRHWRGLRADACCAQRGLHGDDARLRGVRLHSEPLVALLPVADRPLRGPRRSLARRPILGSGWRLRRCLRSRRDATDRGVVRCGFRRVVLARSQVAVLEDHSRRGRHWRPRALRRWGRPLVGFS
mmetsp:Transcript_90858/g.261808  ORF Transcript_90858/g.261808 Transcript_90858/m.261808 type:complete len:207 (+) Transcript_90858:988-1608(+)